MATAVDFQLIDQSLVSDRTKKLFNGYMRQEEKMWKNSDNPYYCTLSLELEKTFNAT